VATGSRRRSVSNGSPYASPAPRAVGRRGALARGHRSARRRVHDVSEGGAECRRVDARVPKNPAEYRALSTRSRRSSAQAMSCACSPRPRWREGTGTSRGGNARIGVLSIRCAGDLRLSSRRKGGERLFRALASWNRICRTHTVPRRRSTTGGRVDPERRSACRARCSRCCARHHRYAHR